MKRVKEHSGGGVVGFPGRTRGTSSGSKESVIQGII